MGIAGLTTYIRNHAEKSLLWHKLHDCNVVIDGNNLAYELYNNGNGINSAFGGDYDKYAEYIKTFFNALFECNIKPLVLLDGGRELNGRKLNTVLSRMNDQVQSCQKIDPSNQFSYRVIGLHSIKVFIKVVEDLGVQLIQCDYEADEEIALVAKQLNCHVVSNDSDFYVFDVSLILLDSLNYKNVQKEVTDDGKSISYIPSYMFDPVIFSEITKLPQSMKPIMGTVLVNDYVTAEDLSSFYRNLAISSKHNYTYRHSVILAVINWLIANKALTPEQIIKRVLSFYNSMEQSYMKRKLETTYEGFNVKSSYILPYLLHSSDCANNKYNEEIKENEDFLCECNIVKSSLRTKDGKILPQWFLKEYRKANIVKEIGDILTKNYFLTLPQIEVRECHSNYLIVQPVIEIFSKLLKCFANVEDHWDDNLEVSENNWETLRKLVLNACERKSISKSNDSNQSNSNDIIKWYLREKSHYKAVKISIPALNSEELPNIQKLNKYSRENHKQLLLELIDIDLELKNLESGIEFIFVIMSYWYANSLIKLKRSHIQTLIICLVMFYIIDGKKKIRRKCNFIGIENKIDNLKSELKTDNSDFAKSSVSKLLKELTEEECLIGCCNLFEYHHLSEKVTRRNYERDLVHTFGEFQACVYFLYALNGLLCSPYEPFSMDRIWNGTFAYNVFIELQENSSFLQFIEKMFYKNSRLYNICLELYKPISIYLEFDDVDLEGNIHLAAKKKKSKKKPKGKKKALEAEIDRIVEFIDGVQIAN